MLDLIIIGAGLSGLMAAYTAAKAGLNVRVVAKGMGATHWAAGTIGVLGYYPLDNRDPVQRPLDRISALIQDNPNHPYALLDAAQRSEALDAFRTLTHEIGLPYNGAEGEEVAGTPGENLLLPSPAGAARPAFLVPEGQLSGSLTSFDPMLIVGFKGMRDFFPHLIADNLRHGGNEARAAFLPIELVTERRDYNTVQLADELERDGRVARLASELKRLVMSGEYIGLPAVLGLERHAHVLTELRSRVGAPIFEIPTLPSSVPGVRLYTALRRRLLEMGVRVETGMEVIESHVVNGRVRWVATETSSRPLKHRAENFLLATGGILGGGFDSDHTGRVWETIFDLPLTTPQKRSEWFRPKFLDPAGHPVYQGGVAVNQDFQPANSDGAPVHENLWAAGCCLAHADPIHERSMEGIAATTGIMAARRIAKSVNSER